MILRRLRRARGLASIAAMALIAAMMMPMFAQTALAQATTGSIRGTVSDQAGATVTDATIVARNQATGVETPVFRPTGEGLYNIPNLTPGTYTLMVESPNFKRAVYTDIEVRLGVDTVIDVILQPGGVSETVTVVASTEEVIQRDQSQVSASFESRKVAELPSNIAGGGIDTLALLAPGVVPGLVGNSNGTTLSVNGQRSRSNNFTIDGQDNNDLSVAGPNYFVQNQDIVQDFQVITNNFSAEYGRNQGAIVNVVTKAGTNEFNGTAFWFHRDRKLFDTLNNLERRSGLEEAPPLLYNVYGGTVGGPIIKDRTFFFGSFQGIRTAETFIARGAGLALLPEELTRLRNMFPNNPAVQALTDFSAFAITDFGTVRPRTDLANPFDTVVIGGQTFRAAFPEREFKTSSFTPSEQEEFTGRIDHKLGDKDSLWGRFLFQDSNVVNALGGSNGFTGDLPARSQNYGVTWTRQVSSRAVNELRFGYTRLYVDFGGGCEGLKGCMPSPSDINQTFPTFTFTGILGQSTGSSLQGVGTTNGLPQGREVQVYQFTDNYSLTFGRHNLRMGADIRRLVNDATFLPSIQGAFTVGNAARLVANNPQQVTISAGVPTINYKETDQFYYFQDDWKIRDNLTLNLGIRYEYIGQPINTLHELTLERESNPATAIFNQSIPIESRIVPKLASDKNNWAPRLGFAWTPRFGNGEGFFGRLLGQDQTVIRGGYSIAYDPPFYNILINIANTAPVVFNNVTPNPAAGPAIFPVPSTLTAEGVRQFAEANNIIVPANPIFQNQSQVASDFRLPYAQQWSLGVQRQLGSNNVVEARYVGTRGVGLFQTLNVNPSVEKLLNGFTAFGINFRGFPELLPPGLTPQVAGQGDCVDDPVTPAFNEASRCAGRVRAAGVHTARHNTASSIYHALQTRYNGRIGNHLTLGASYTFSKSLDTASEIFAFGENSSQPQNIFDLKADRSYSQFDRPHALALNGIWDLPFFKDQNGFVGRVLGGWQINGTYMLTSGQRFTPSQFSNQFFWQLLPGAPTYLDPQFADYLRPFNGNPNAPKTSVGIHQVDAFLLGLLFGIDVPLNNPNTLYSLAEFNQGNLVEVSSNDVRYIFNGPGAAQIFGTPFGNVTRNSAQGPRLNQMNMGFFKNTRITEKVRIQFRTEIFNLLNHPNPGYGLLAAETVNIPNNLIDDAGIEGSAFNEFTDMQLSRRAIQFGIRLIF